MNAIALDRETKEMDRPNLFAFATSELSQDAFISWLLAWASPEYGEANEPLQQLGRTFLTELACAANIAPPDPAATVTVSRQVKGLDIVVEIGDSHVIGIEDKIDTRDHSRQLERYRERLHHLYPGKKIALVYLKTGDQDSYTDVVTQGWTLFTRADLLKVLRTGDEEIDCSILADYRDYLTSIERDVDSYRHLPPDRWSWRAWTGFFGALQSRLGSGGWGYVPNKSGGFMGFWWGWNTVADGELYLQLEERILTTKVAVSDKRNRRQVRNHWCQVVTSRVDDPPFARPKRLGNGRWMTVGANSEYLQLTPDGSLDLDRTVAFLNRAAEAIRAIAGPSV